MANKKKEKESQKKETKLVVEEVLEEPTKTEEKSEDKKEKEKPKDQEKKESPEQEKNKKEKGQEDLKEEVKEVVESKVTIKQVLMIAVPTAIIVAALTGGILFYMNNSNVSEGKPSKKTSSTPVAEQTSAPTPTPTLKRSDLTIKVLNGSGTSGVAGKAQTFLEGLGYEGVETGNASSFDFENTVVSVKKEKQEYLDMIIEDLSKEYEVSSKSGTLDEGSAFDVEITVGKN